MPNPRKSVEVCTSSSLNPPGSVETCTSSSSILDPHGSVVVGTSSPSISRSVLMIATQRDWTRARAV